MHIQKHIKISNVTQFLGLLQIFSMRHPSVHVEISVLIPKFMRNAHSFSFDTNALFRMLIGKSWEMEFSVARDALTNVQDNLNLFISFWFVALIFFLPTKITKTL